MKDDFKSEAMRNLYKEHSNTEGSYLVYHIFYDGIYNGVNCRMPGKGYIGQTRLGTKKAVVKRYKIKQEEIKLGLVKPSVIDNMIKTWSPTVGIRVLCSGLTEAESLQIEGLLRPPCLTFNFDKFIWNVNPGGKIYNGN